MAWPTPIRPAVAVSAVLSIAALGLGCARQAEPIEEAALLASKGQERRAITVLETFLAEHPDALAERRLLVRMFGAVGDLPAAEREIGELARRLPPDSPVPFIELGHVLELAHRYDEALAAYDRAAESAPRSPEGPRTGGLRAARWGEPELAAPRLEEALRRNPRDAEVWHALGLVRAHLDDLDGARVAYESGLAADPEALENRIGLATLALVRDDPAAALAQYDAIVARRPGFADAHLGRSWALIRMGRLGEARRALGKARASGGDSRVIDAQTRLIEEVLAKREPEKNR